MKATVDRKEMVSALGEVKGIAPYTKHNTLKVLGYVLLTAKKGGVSLTTTNLDASLRETVKADLDKGGSICAPIKDMEKILKTFTTEKVTLEATEKKVTFSGNGARVSFDAIDAEQFPPIPEVKGSPVVVDNLADLLKEVEYAMADEKDARPVLTGVCFNPGRGILELVAADGFRLAYTHTKPKGKLKRQFILPAEAVKEIRRLMPGPVTIRDNGTDVSFESNGLVLVSRPVSGTFPNWNQLIPKGGTPFEIPVDKLREGLKMVLAIDPRGGIVRLKSITNIVLRLSAVNEDDGECDVSVPCKGKIQIAFNAKYLMELTGKIEDTMLMQFTDGSSPVKIIGNGNTLHLLMPMFVQW